MKTATATATATAAPPGFASALATLLGAIDGPFNGVQPRAERLLVRTWRGATRAQDAERYVSYLHQTGFKEYRETAGNRGVLALRRILGDKAEFLLVTLWESEAAVRRFAGPEPDKAVFYPEDDAFLVERDNHVGHFEVVFRSGELATC